MPSTRPSPAPDSTPTPDSRDSTAEDVRLRIEANDLAHEDGRDEALDKDREAALRDHAVGGPAAALEIPAGAEGLTDWDVGPDEAGHRTPESTSDDEADDAATLAETGVDEAEKDLRRAAAHSRRPPHPESGA